MSRGNFKVSINQLFGHSLIFLVGVILAAFFIYFSPQELQVEFFERFSEYFVFTGIGSCIFLILKECFWIFLIALFSYIPYGRLSSLLIILYKGFSVGVISSIAYSKLGFGGLKYTFFLVLPPNLFYILSLCIAAQISFEISVGLPCNIGRHGKTIPTNRRAYLICFLLTLIGGFVESYYVPWMYKILF